jgi:FkbM family methyltransferase
MIMTFSKIFKECVKKTVRSAGFNITKYTPGSSETEKLNTALKYFGIELLIDVGANTGQYAESVRQAGYKKKIVSFEPLVDAYKQLLINSANDKMWFVHERTAIGNQNGEIEINVSGNSQSSSILPMLATHSDAAPNSKYFKTEKTKIIKLDSVFSDYRLNSEVTFLKIDTQGYEREVLEGAKETLEKVKAIQIELSLVPLYAGQPLWDAILLDLAKKGFQVWSILPGFSDPHIGRSLQIDAVLYKA